MRGRKVGEWSPSPRRVRPTRPRPARSKAGRVRSRPVRPRSSDGRAFTAAKAAEASMGRLRTGPQPSVQVWGSRPRDGVGAPPGAVFVACRLTGDLESTRWGSDCATPGSVAVPSTRIRRSGVLGRFVVDGRPARVEIVSHQHRARLHDANQYEEPKPVVRRVSREWRTQKFGADRHGLRWARSSGTSTSYSYHSRSGVNPSTAFTRAICSISTPCQVCTS